MISVGGGWDQLHPGAETVGEADFAGEFEAKGLGFWPEREAEGSAGLERSHPGSLTGQGEPDWFHHNHPINPAPARTSIKCSLPPELGRALERFDFFLDFTSNRTRQIKS